MRIHEARSLSRRRFLGKVTLAGTAGLLGVRPGLAKPGSSATVSKIPGHHDVLDIGKPLALQEFFGHVQGGETDGGAFRQPELDGLGGGSAVASPGCRPRHPAVPARASPLRNLRRLNGLACWILMRTSLPDAGQCGTYHAARWTLLLSHEEAQHLTTLSGRFALIMRVVWAFRAVLPDV